MSTTIDDRISARTRAEIQQDNFGHVIDGERVAAGNEATLDIIDPATGTVIAAAAAGTVDDVDRAARSARAAYEDGRWRNLAPMAKEKVLRNMAGLLAERGELFAEVDVLDAGLLRTYTGFIVQFAVDGLEYFSGWPSKLQGAVPAVPVEFNVYQMREPIGVVGLIMPWNGPTAVFAMVAAALAAGNSVILKPAEQTPMAAVLMAELAVEAGLPPGVFNIVQGYGHTVGQALVEHPDVDAISFTGSVATGSAIQAAAAKRVKRVSLELGGKSPFIVFPDADFDVASATSMAAVWGASGPGVHLRHPCPRARIDLRRMGQPHHRRNQGHEIGPGIDPTTEMGPVVSAAQLDRIKRYVAIGQEEGAELVLGGTRSASGATSTNQPCSPACETTCASPKRRSSDRSWASSRSATRTTPIASRTTSPTASPPACGPTTSHGPNGQPEPSRPAPCGSTPTRWSTQACPTAASSCPATAAPSGPRPSRR